MNPRNTMILALVVAALGAFLYFYEIRGQEERAEAEEAAKRLFPGISADQIDVLVVSTSDDKQVRLERSGERWRITEPVRFPADQIRADGLASTLASLGSEAVFDAPEPLEEYGIGSDPTIRFWVGDVEHSLYLGDKTPVGGNSYAKTGEGAQVYAVKSYHATSLTRSMHELRDARVLDFDRDAVERIQASWPGGGVVIEKGETGWRLLEPLSAAADSDAVDALLSNLKYLRADDFIDELPADAEVGLDAPAFDVELVGAAGAEGEPPTRSRMTIGARVEASQRAVRGSAEHALYRIAAERLDDFPRSVVAYRFKTLADFDEGAAARFELVFPAEGENAPLIVIGERGEEGWTTSPERMAAGKASRLITEFARLTAVDIAADAMGEDELRGVGLAPPAATFRAFAEAEQGEERALLAEIRLGKADPDRGIAAQRSGDDVVYWLDYALAEHLPVHREAFENRFLTSEQAEEPEATSD